MWKLIIYKNNWFIFFLVQISVFLFQYEQFVGLGLNAVVHMSWT